MTTGALTGIKVLDTGRYVLGPLAGVMLGDLGADVVKIEEPLGDPSRAITDVSGVDVSLPDGGSSMFEIMNRNKRSLALDLGREEGRQLLRDLARVTDILIEDPGPGGLDFAQLGLDYKALSASNPRLIYGAASAYGRKGPDAGRPILDPLIQARSGLMWSGGGPGDPPNWSSMGTADVMGGQTLAYGLVAAIAARERTGQGQRVDVSELMASLWLQYWAIEVCVLNHLPEWARFDRKSVGNPLWNFYECADGEWISLGMIDSERDWEPFCRIMELPHLIDDPRSRTVEARIENAAVLIEELDRRFAAETRPEWERRIGANPNLIYTRVQRIGDLPTDPAVQANEYLVDVDHPRYGPTKMLNHPVTLKATPAAIRRTAPGLGEHSAEILQEWLGLGEDRIAGLRSDAVITA